MAWEQEAGGDAADRSGCNQRSASSGHAERASERAGSQPCASGENGQRRGPFKVAANEQGGTGNRTFVKLQ